MKRTYLALIIGLLLIAGAIAGGITLSSKDFTYASSDADLLNKYSMNGLKYTDLVCDDTICTYTILNVNFPSTHDVDRSFKTNKSFSNDNLQSTDIQNFLDMNLKGIKQIELDNQAKLDKASQKKAINYGVITINGK